MSETGFGSVTYNPAPEVYDAGFGSPYDVSGRETGFGSPYDPTLAPASVLTGLAIGDDGGERIDIAGAWYSIAPEPVPAHSSAFTVHFIHTVTSKRTPALAGYIGGTGGQVYTNVKQTMIHAYVPPLEHGLYDVEVSYSSGVTLISNAFEVIPRLRSSEVYAMRKALPSFYKRGAVSPESDPLEEMPTYSNLEALTRSLGQLCQNFAGKSFTLLTQQWLEGATVLHVESTLGFDDAGALLVSDMRFTYTGKTSNSFTGLAFEGGHLLASIPKKTKVVRYDKPS